MSVIRVGQVCALVGIVCSCAAPPLTKAKTAPQPKAPPQLDTPSPEDLPGLDAEDISPVVMARYGAVGGCHTIQYSGQQSATGAVTVDWTIQPDGRVLSAEVVASSFADTDFHDCVLSVATLMKFPEAPGTTAVTWKFRFAAKQDAANNSPATLR